MLSPKFHYRGPYQTLSETRVYDPVSGEVRFGPLEFPTSLRTLFGCRPVRSISTCLDFVRGSARVADKVREFVFRNDTTMQTRPTNSLLPESRWFPLNWRRNHWQKFLKCPFANIVRNLPLQWLQVPVTVFSVTDVLSHPVPIIANKFAAPKLDAIAAVQAATIIPFLLILLHSPSCLKSSGFRGLWVYGSGYITWLVS